MYFQSLIMFALIILVFLAGMVVRYLMRIDSKMAEMRGLAARDEKSIQKEIIINFLVAALVSFLLFNIGKFGGMY